MPQAAMERLPATRTHLQPVEAAQEPVIMPRGSAGAGPRAEWVATGRDGPCAIMIGERVNHVTASQAACEAAIATGKLRHESATRGQRPWHTSAEISRKNAVPQGMKKRLFQEDDAAVLDEIPPRSLRRPETRATRPSRRGEPTNYFNAETAPLEGTNSAPEAEKDGRKEATEDVTASVDWQLLLHPIKGVNSHAATNATLPQTMLEHATPANPKATAGTAPAVLEITLIPAARAAGSAEAKEALFRTPAAPTQASCLAWQVREAGTVAQNNTSDFSSTHNSVSDDWGPIIASSCFAPVGAGATDLCSAAWFSSGGGHPSVSSLLVSTAPVNERFRGDAAALLGVTFTRRPVRSSIAAAATSPAMGESDENSRQVVRSRPETLPHSSWDSVVNNTLQEEINSRRLNIVEGLPALPQRQSASGMEHNVQQELVYLRNIASSPPFLIKAVSRSAVADAPCSGGHCPPENLYARLEEAASETTAAARMGSEQLSIADAALHACEGDASMGERDTEAAACAPKRQGATVDADWTATQRVADKEEAYGASEKTATIASGAGLKLADAATRISAVETRELSLEEDSAEPCVERKARGVLLLPSSYPDGLANQVRDAADTSGSDLSILQDAGAAFHASASLQVAVKRAFDGIAAAWAASHPSALSAAAENDCRTKAVLSAENISSLLLSATGAASSTSQSAATLSNAVTTTATSNSLAAGGGNVAPASIVDARAIVPSASEAATADTGRTPRHEKNSSSTKSRSSVNTSNTPTLAVCGNCRDCMERGNSSGNPDDNSCINMKSVCSVEEGCSREHLYRRSTSKSLNTKRSGSETRSQSHSNSRYYSDGRLISSAPFLAFKWCWRNGQAEKSVPDEGDGGADCGVQQQLHQHYNFEDLQQQLLRGPPKICKKSVGLLHTPEREITHAMLSTGAVGIPPQNRSKTYACMELENCTATAVDTFIGLDGPAESSTLEAALKATVVPPLSSKNCPAVCSEQLVFTGATTLIPPHAGPAKLAISNLSAPPTFHDNTTTSFVNVNDARTAADTETATVVAASKRASVVEAHAVSVPHEMPVALLPCGHVTTNSSGLGGISTAAASTATLAAAADSPSVCSILSSSSITRSPSIEILETLLQQKQLLIHVLQQLLVSQQQQQQHILLLLQQQQPSLLARSTPRHVQVSRCIGAHESATVSPVHVQHQTPLRLLLHEQQRLSQPTCGNQQQLVQLVLPHRLVDHKVNQTPTPVAKPLLWHTPSRPSAVTRSALSSEDDIGPCIHNSGNHSNNRGRDGSHSQIIQDTESGGGPDREKQRASCRSSHVNSILSDNADVAEATVNAATVVACRGAPPPAKGLADATAAQAATHKDVQPRVTAMSENGTLEGFSMSSNSVCCGARASDTYAAATTAAAAAELKKVLLSPDDLSAAVAAPADQQPILQSLCGAPVGPESKHCFLLHSPHALFPGEEYFPLDTTGIAGVAVTTTTAEQNNRFTCFSGDQRSPRAAEAAAVSPLQRHREEIDTPPAKRIKKDTSGNLTSTQSGGLYAALTSGGCGRATTAATKHITLTDFTVAPADDTQGKRIRRKPTGVATPKRAVALESCSGGRAAHRKGDAVQTECKDQADALDYAVRARTCERVSGVCFDRWNQGWIATWRNQRRPVHKHYSVKKYGFEQARLLAIRHRHYMVLQQQKAQQRQLQQELELRSYEKEAYKQHPLETPQQEHLQGSQWQLKEQESTQQARQPEQHYLLQLRGTVESTASCANAVVIRSLPALVPEVREKEAATPVAAAAATAASSAQMRSLFASTLADTQAALIDRTVATGEACVNPGGGIPGATTVPSSPAAVVKAASGRQLFDSAKKEELNSAIGPALVTPREPDNLAEPADAAVNPVSGAAQECVPVSAARETGVALSTFPLLAIAPGRPLVTADLSQATAVNSCSSAVTVAATPGRREQAVKSTPMIKAAVAASPRRVAADTSPKERPLADKAAPKSCQIPGNEMLFAEVTPSPRCTAPDMLCPSSPTQECGVSNAVTEARLEEQGEEQQISASWPDVATLVARMPKVERVSFDFTNHSWIAQWKRQGSATYRRFAVSKFGFQGAFELAVLYKEQHYRPVTTTPYCSAVDASSQYAATAAGGASPTSRQRKRRVRGGGAHRSKAARKSRQQQQRRPREATVARSSPSAAAAEPQRVGQV